MAENAIKNSKKALYINTDRGDNKISVHKDWQGR
jgi:hypothetical protein